MYLHIDNKAGALFCSWQTSEERHSMHYYRTRKGRVKDQTKCLAWNRGQRKFECAEKGGTANVGENYNPSFLPFISETPCIRNTPHRENTKPLGAMPPPDPGKILYSERNILRRFRLSVFFPICGGNERRVAALCSGAGLIHGGSDDVYNGALYHGPVLTIYRYTPVTCRK